MVQRWRLQKKGLYRSKLDHPTASANQMSVRGSSTRARWTRTTMSADTFVRLCPRTRSGHGHDKILNRGHGRGHGHGKNEKPRTRTPKVMMSADTDM